MFSVIIVDDHSLVLQSLSLLVNSFKKFKVIGLFKNGNLLFNDLESKQNKPDIILMDVRMPIINGIECTKIIKSRFPAIKIIGLTGDETYETLIHMFDAGADGYLIKSVDNKKFEKYLIDVIYHNHEFTEILPRVTIDSIKKNSLNSVSILTKKESEFIQLACSKMNYQQIAFKMHLSPRTIDGYRDSIYYKLEIRTRVELVIFAIKNGIFKI